MQKVQISRQAPGTAGVAVVAMTMALAAGIPATAQTVRVEVDVDTRMVRDVVREIQRAIDVPLLRDLGQEVALAIRGAIAEIPWRDMGWDRLPWPDIQWRDVAAAAGAEQNRDFRVEQTDKATRTVALGPAGSLDLRNIAGPISVTAGSGKDVTIEIVRTSRGRTDADAKNGLEQVTVDVDHRGERATVNARYPSSRGRQEFSVTVGYVVTAPPGTHVTVGGFSTDTTIKGIKGDISVELVAGTIAISGASRVSSAKTFSGTIAITDVDGDGNVTASSISGVVTIERVKGRQINVNSLSGGIVARDVNVENAVLKTMNGGIEYSGGVSRTGRYEMQTHNGSIKLTLGGEGFDLRAQTFGGEIKPAAGMDLRNMSLTGRSLRGTAGTGGATIVATTFNGTITVGRK